MSYADAKLDLTSLGIACLTGQNGAGKSAILDGVTWALWENARAGSEDLIRLGQSEMWVYLCWELEGQIYRVRRSRQKSYGKDGKRLGSKGNLDLQIWKADRQDFYAAESPLMERDSVWMSLNAATMRDTQKRLDDILKMDYDTFVSSVYLRQGRADEFTTRSPSERKQVLADILGLDYFDRLQELAKEEAKERKIRVQVLESALSSACDLEQGLIDSLSDFTVLSAELETCEENLSGRLAEINALGEELTELRYFDLRSDSALKRQEEVQHDLSALEERRFEMEARLQQKLHIVKRAEDVKKQAAEFEELKKQGEALDNAALALHDLNNKRMEVKSKIDTAKGRIEVELEHLQAQLNGQLARQKALAKSERDSSKLEEQFTAFRELLNEELEMSRKREQFVQLSARAEELQSRVSESRVRLDEEIQQKRSMLEELERIMLSKDLLGAEQEELKSKLEELELVEVEFESVEERGIKIKSKLETIEQQIRQLKRHLKENDEKVRELKDRPSLSNCPLCRSPIVDSLAVLDRYSVDSTNTESEVASLEEQAETLVSEREQLRKRYVSLRKLLDTRKVLDTKIGEFNEKQAALSRAKSSRDELQSGIEQSKEKLVKQDFAQVERESLIRIKVEINRLEFDPVIYANLQSQIRAQRHIELRHQQLQADLRELADIQKTIPLLEEQIKSLTEQLDGETFEVELRVELKLLDDEAAKYNYDRKLHQTVKQRLVSLLPAAEAVKEINQALVELPELESDILQLKESIHTKQTELHKLEADLQAWRANLDQLPVLTQEITKKKQIAAVLETDREGLLRRKIGLESRLSHLRSGKSDLDAKKDLLTLTLKEITEFNTLAETFGKKGLQAIIIENAIPEIESEANRILSRLSDNQMHVALITQQRGRQGQPMETLDILIADEVGTRGYELYSGGEAFKVNFAIRVALSRLLARRAGAKLETLIIDEGFGSQDESSRAKLIRAIASIQPDFARILVVTHIADVRETFPSHIVVSKEDGISQLQVIA